MGILWKNLDSGAQLMMGSCSTRGETLRDAVHQPLLCKSGKVLGSDV